MSLKRKAFQSILWSFAHQFSGQIVNFVVSIILARILSPSDFGLVGLISILIAVGNALMDGGLASSLVRTQNADDRDFSTVFYTNLLSSVIIYICFFFIAPLVSIFFNQNALTSIIRVFSLTFIFNAFSSIQLVRLIKEMNFKTQLLIKLPIVIVSGLIGIYMAYKNFGVWSLIYMALIQSFMSSLLLWLRSNWHPKLIFDKIKFKLHFNFGYKLMLSSVMDAFANNAYNVVIGKFFSISQMGYFTRALNTRDLPVQNITMALNKVTYPLFSKIKDDNVKLKNVYRQVMSQVLFWISFILFGLAIIAIPLFKILFTEKWLPSVPYFQILCIAGIMFPLNGYNLNILNVKGRSDLFFKLSIINKLLIFVGILFSFQFGIYGLLYYSIINGIIAYLINTTYSGNMINYSLIDQLRDIFPIIFTTGLSAVLSYIIGKLLFSSSINDVFKILCYSTIYLAFIIIISSFMKLNILKDLKQLRD